jgi:tRNA pseudouridine38-40 synthase
MPRYKLTIEYDGTEFCGWQRQEEGIKSVQGTIEAAVMSLSNQLVLVEGSGRTDRGVHALEQVAHVDLEKTFAPYQLREGLNFFLRNQGVVILSVEEVPDTFHARFSAKSRTYVYKILNRRAPLALEHNRAWHIPKPLDVGAMSQAAQHFIGHHDFTTFRSAHCQAPHALRTLDRFDLYQEGAFITAIIKSRSFLHNQVRIMMGSIAKIGRREWTPSYIQDLLEIKDRRKAGATAPAHGLYLAKVEY